MIDYLSPLRLELNANASAPFTMEFFTARSPDDVLEEGGRSESALITIAVFIIVAWLIIYLGNWRLPFRCASASSPPQSQRIALW